MKKTTALILAFLFLLPLVSCARNKPVDPGETAAPGVTAGPGEPSETKEPGSEEIIAAPEPLPADIDFSYTFDPNTDCIESGGVSFSDGFAETEDAYYWKSGWGSYIFYSDKVSGEFGALCGKPDCLHEKSPNNIECNALVGNGPKPEIYVYDGKLYFMRTAKAADGRMLDTVFREELDGSNRERLFSVDCYKYAFQSFYIHRGKAFFTAATDVVEDGVPKKRLEFFCGDLNGDGPRSVFEKTIGGQQGISFSVGFFGDYAFFFVSSYPISDDGANADTAIYAYDLKNDKVYLVASQEDCEISIWAIYVDTNGEIYVVPSIFNRKVQAGVYKVVDGDFVKQYEFEGEEYFGTLIQLGCGYAYVTSGYGFEEPTLIWIKDMDGNTVYNGPLTRHFLEGRENVTKGFISPKIHGNSLIISYAEWLEDDPNYTILVRYEITENGLVETTLAEY